MQAKPVSIQQAQRVAEAILPGQAFVATDLDGLYLFSSFDGKGFVLVSGDDCVRPLLAYSYDGIFDADKMPAHVAAWIDGYRREIASVAAADIAPSPEIQAMWENFVPSKSGDNYVNPLLTTRWSQRPYYNSLCPYDIYDSTNAVTGCTATAMAQIMKYWEWPLVGWNSHIYNHQRYGTLSADFGNTVYRWDRMPDTLSALCDSLEIDAVATLMYHAGVAVEMNYGTGASGAATVASRGFSQPSAENALKTYFRYNPLLFGSTKDGRDDAEWDAMLRADLDAARPVLYSGYDDYAGGHAFVLDGYDTLGMFHVNWGWGGYYDAYYTIDSLSPGAGSLGGDPLYTFNSRNGALFNVYPVAETIDTVVTVDFAVNDADYGNVEGNGTYHPYDTVTIIPHAVEGYRYLRLSSGLNMIPLTFLAVNNVTDTVLFERIEGDTIGYCNDNAVTAWHDDYSSVTEWGIRIPPVMRQSRQLNAVQLFVYMGAYFNMNIYVGDSIDGATLVYSDQYYITDEETGWNTLPLDSMLTFDPSAVVWITFNVDVGNDRYPASCASFCGNSDGSWYHLPDGWQPYDQQGEYYTWMIRAIFSPRTWLNVAVTPNEINYGDVLGMGHYPPGYTVPLSALPKNGYQFSHWSNGSTDNPMTFVITSDTTFIAFFEPIIGIEEVENPDLKVEISNLTLTVTLPADISSAALYDIQGRELASFNSPCFTFHVPIPGVYLLKAVGLPARKVVVTR